MIDTEYFQNLYHNYIQYGTKIPFQVSKNCEVEMSLPEPAIAIFYTTDNELAVRPELEYLREFVTNTPDGCELKSRGEFPKLVALVTEENQMFDLLEVLENEDYAAQIQGLINVLDRSKTLRFTK